MSAADRGEICVKTMMGERGIWEDLPRVRRNCYRSSHWNDL